MKKALLFALACAFVGRLRAASTHAEAMAEYEAAVKSLQKPVAGFLASNLGKGAGFMSGFAGFSPVSARKKFHFNLGLGGGASITPLDKSGAKKLAGSNASIVGFVDALPVML